MILVSLDSCKFKLSKDTKIIGIGCKLVEDPEVDELIGHFHRLQTEELVTAESQSLTELMDNQGPDESEEKEAEREEQGPSESYNHLSMSHSIQLPSFF
uniref:Uncharacterized protein n=1 Tax=Acrobeloides nanus TaxID=290746 RepID=A0A914DQ37_9BILA